MTSVVPICPLELTINMTFTDFNFNLITTAPLLNVLYNSNHTLVYSTSITLTEKELEATGVETMKLTNDRL